MAEPESTTAATATDDVSAPAASEQRAGRFTARQRRIARTVLIVLAIVAVVTGLFVWRYEATHESTDDAQIEGDIVPISARVGGTIKAVSVQDNQFVQAGTVLVEIDPIDYEVALRRAEAELADAEAQAAAARTSVPITRSTTSGQLGAASAVVAAARREVEATRARLAEAQANAAKAAADRQRFAQLVEKDEVSRQQFDAVVAADTAAQATVKAAEAAIAAAESRVAQAEAQERAAGSAPEQVQVSESRAGAAEAVLAKNRAAVEQARLNLGYTTVKAPAAGIVSRKTVQLGQVIQPGQPLASIVPVERPWVVANYKENQLRKMKVGQRVDIHVDAYGRDYRGHVESIGGATAGKFSLLPAENATGNFVKVVQRVPVKIVFEEGQDSDHLLRPGLSVVPTVHTD